MVDTIKFSEMNAGGDLPLNSKTPGLLSGANVLFNNPWTFLPSGDTASRPTPSSAINYRLRFNTSDQLYEYYDAVLGSWVQLQENAFTAGPFVTFTASSFLPDAQNLGLLTNGILRQTITTGVATLDIAVNGIDYYGPGFTGYLISPAGIADANSNPILSMSTAGASSVNFITIGNNISGQVPTITASGTDSNVGIVVLAKGTGTVGFRSNSVSIPFNFYSGTLGQHQTNFAMANTAANRTATWQDSDGTIAWLTDIPAGSPSALSRTNDTNVTVTLGGTPSTALLQAVSLTMGWSGTLAETRGGTAQSTYTLGDILYSSAANTLSKLAGNTTSGIKYLSQTGTGVASAAPAWATISGGDITGAALTKTDDTNVTLSLGGTPSTALLRAASLTLGWTGTLSGTRGGTGVNNGASTITLGGSLTTSGAFASTFTMTGVTGVTFPTSGTLATTSQIPTGAALTKTDDTNVTLTLGGSPTTALVNAASLTLGWTGQLGLTRGGTAASLTASNGGIVYSTASALAILSGTATAGQMLQSGANAAPTWSTATFPTTAGSAGTILRSNGTNWIASTSTFADTYSASTLLYSNGANTVSGLATANNGILVTSAGGVPSIGNIVGADLTIHTLTVGQGASGISTNTAFGVSALASISSAGSVTGIGYQAAKNITTGGNNTCVGYAAGTGLVAGISNVAIGFNTLAAGDPNNCVAIGQGAMSSATTAAVSTVAIGVNAALNVTGTSNVMIGTSAGSSSGTFSGGSNVAIGAETLRAATTTASSIYIGIASGNSITSGGNNVFLGANTGITTGGATAITTGANNILIGGSSGSNNAGAIGVISIGYLSVAPQATGATSADNGASIALGSASAYVGFRGDNSLYPTASVGAGTLPLTFAGYWRIFVNGTAYKIPLYPD